MDSIWQPGGTQERSRDAQEAPKRRLRASKRRPRTPKSRPRGAWEDPKPSQNRARAHPRRDFGTFFVRRSIRKAPGPIFHRFLFFGRRAARAMCSKHKKNPGKIVVFTHSEVFRIASVRARKTLQKCTSESSKSLPRASQIPPKSSPERPKTLKNRLIATTNAARSEKWAQEAPKIEK